MSTDRPTIFHILSFEGPDPYARAGGIASRITGLARALGASPSPTHLWFVGDPESPGHETLDGVHLHRWCQWISRFHPGGVYDGEDGKVGDYSTSLPPYLLENEIRPAAESGRRTVILAEEWHTVGAVLHLDELLRREGLRDQVRVFWNANNRFGFERIDWARLEAAATITTVSRFMKHQMWPLGVDPVVVPNGLPVNAFEVPERAAVAALRETFRERLLLAKIARWDPDKRWLLAVRGVAELKRHGLRPLLVARGGVEAHGAEVLAEAAAAGLRIVRRSPAGPGVRGWIEALRTVNGADLVALDAPVEPEALRAIYRAADAVLANSGREPFGLVGLEAMAAGGIACTGCTGEDYAVAGRNAVVLQTNEPRELVGELAALHANQERKLALRRAARTTARHYAWSEVIDRDLLPRIDLADR